jgi:glutamate N-acetyltransferase/amino-acid N-acetyltransferase
LAVKSICAVEGVSAAGIKEGRYGLALIRAGGAAAGMFTTNRVRAAPIQMMMERIKTGRLEGIIVNSGNANAYTGTRGMDDAFLMAEICGECLGIDPGTVGVASTGIIGRYLNLDLIADQARRITPRMGQSEEIEEQVCAAIMTTDLVQKHALVEGEGFCIGGIAKGSGMIAPNMGTMLAFLYTDAVVDSRDLQEALRLATKRSFNRIVVDGDTSTNDAVFCTATGDGERVAPSTLSRALEEVCVSLAQKIARDGEGATKLIEMRVCGAEEEEDAARIARTIVSSPLVKTAVYGEDPNWGRIIAAAGRSGVDFDPGKISLMVGEGSNRVVLVQNGEIFFKAGADIGAMKEKTVVFTLDLNTGTEEATAWGCDLTEDYVRINGKYTT